MASAFGGMSGMGWLAGAGTLLQVFGQLESGRAARINGQRQQVEAEFAAEQAEKNAGTVIALSQRTAAEENRKGRYDTSRALAVAVASGASASDPTIVRILSNVKGEATYRANNALYEGEAKARALRLEAIAGRYSGAMAVVTGAETQQQYTYAALGTGFMGSAGLYSRYGMGGPSASKGDSSLVATVPYSNRM